MARKRDTLEQTMSRLREIEVDLAQGKKTPRACRKAGVRKRGYYRRT